MCRPEGHTLPRPARMASVRPSIPRRSPVKRNLAQMDVVGGTTMTNSLMHSGGGGGGEWRVGGRERERGLGGWGCAWALEAVVVQRSVTPCWAREVEEVWAEECPFVGQWCWPHRTEMGAEAWRRVAPGVEGPSDRPV